MPGAGRSSSGIVRLFGALVAVVAVVGYVVFDWQFGQGGTLPAVIAALAVVVAVGRELWARAG